MSGNIYPGMNWASINARLIAMEILLFAVGYNMNGIQFDCNSLSAMELYPDLP